MSQNMAEGRVENSPAKPKKKYKYNIYTECKHSPSCFKCPLADCEAGITRALYFNALPADRYRYKNIRKFRLYS